MYIYTYVIDHFPWEAQFRANETNDSNEIARAKNPTWPEANQLTTSSAANGRVEPGFAQNISSW